MVLSPQKQGAAVAVVAEGAEGAGGEAGIRLLHRRAGTLALGPARAGVVLKTALEDGAGGQPELLVVAVACIASQQHPNQHRQ